MLTPDELRVKEFVASRRGYDADEVRAFLDQLADELTAERANQAAREVAIREATWREAVTAANAEFQVTVGGLQTDMARLQTEVARLQAEVAARDALVHELRQGIGVPSPSSPGNELDRTVTRLGEELDLAVWTMRRLEAGMQRLEERLDTWDGPGPRSR